MSSSHWSSDPHSADGPEPFPTFPDSQTQGSSSQQHNSNSRTTTTTTTTVMSNHNGTPTVTTSTSQPYQPGNVPTILENSATNVVPYSQTTQTVPFQIRRRPIGIRRLPSASSVRAAEDGQDIGVGRSGSGRARSSSAPQGYHPGAKELSRQDTRASAVLPTLAEESSGQQPQRLQVPGIQQDAEQNSSGVGRRRSLSNAARSVVSKFSQDEESRPPYHEYDSNVVDFLDVVDPEVSTLTTLTNVQNSLFVPDLGRWLNRRPTYNLTRAPTRVEEVDSGRVVTAAQPEDEVQPPEPLSQKPSMQRTWSWQRRPAPERSHSISSEMNDDHYAVLPPGVSLDDWSEEDKEALDDHVRHMLHSKRSKFNQSMKAFGKYVRNPLGLFVTLYAVCITLFGLAWVLCLIGWIYAGNRQSYIINVVDNVLVALFALMGDGLAPFRIVDTYHMIYIAHYHHLTWDKRKKKALPNLQDQNDLPEQREKDPEAAIPEDTEVSVLTERQQKRLQHHQAKFSRSHSFYKPHETATHHAFPLRLLVAVVVLLDCHSLFQIALGTCTWSIDYRTRPQALTATILCCSITVNITAGVLISIGDRRTRKKDVVMRMARQELTQQAIKKVEKHKADREASVQHSANKENFGMIPEEEGHVGSKSPSQSRF